MSLRQKKESDLIQIDQFRLQIVEVNSSRELIYTQIVNRNTNQTQTPENYVKNQRRKKSRRKERLH